MNQPIATCLTIPLALTVVLAAPFPSWAVCAGPAICTHAEIIPRIISPLRALSDEIRSAAAESNQQRGVREPNDRTYADPDADLGYFEDALLVESVVVRERKVPCGRPVWLEARHAALREPEATTERRLLCPPSDDGCDELTPGTPIEVVIQDFECNDTVGPPRLTKDKCGTCLNGS